MRNRDPFSDCHPVVGLVYFAEVLFFSMCLMHPAALALSLASAAVCRVCLGGWRALRASLRYALPVLLLAAAANPLFNHAGATILTYLPSGNPLTLESILYGLAAGAMLAAVLTWFACCSAVMTSEKLIYLFGRAIPALSLLLSMALRFVPRFRARLETVWEGQRGLYGDPESARARVKRAVTALSATVTWAMERAVDAADSMRSRGYGLPGRTAFSVYRFDGRDRAVLLWTIGCGLYVLAGWAAGGLSWRYYPTVRGGTVTPLSVSFFLSYQLLCLTPAILKGWEVRQWTRSQSEI